VPESRKGEKPPQKRLSRLEQLKALRGDEAYAPEMPPVEDAAYLLDYLWQVGPTMAAGMGAGPITHEELQAWQRNAGVELQPWEVRFLRRLSIDYIGEQHRAEKADCPAPWQGEAQRPERELVAKSMRSSILALAQM
jgi:hypothetical protein